jgi:hypothetical protein
MENRTRDQVEMTNKAKGRRTYQTWKKGKETQRRTNELRHRVTFANANR